MADKSLTEAEWKKFAKGRELKDAGLLKSLAAFDKALKGDADARLQALAEIDVQIDLLKASKAVRGDKEVLAHLGQIEKDVEKERTAAEQAAQAEQDSEDSPAQLSTRMVPLLRNVPKGEAMNVMIALLGKETVVLVSRKAVGAPQRKLLASQFEGGGTPKYVTGQCIYEEKAHTFVLQTQAAGLAKKVKAALLEQTELRYKVRVRGLDPSDVDDDGDVEPIPDDETGAPPSGESTTAEQAPTRSREQLAYEMQLRDIAGPLKVAMADRPGDVARLKALLKFATQKADAGDYGEALMGLNALAGVIEGATAPGGQEQGSTTSQATREVKSADAFNARLGALLPRIQQALKAGGAQAAELKRLVADAGTAARDKTYDIANQLLDQAEQLLEKAPAKESGTAKPGPADEAGWLRRLESTETIYQMVLGQNPADATKLRAVMSYANEQAETGQYAKAIAALDRLDGLLAQAQAAGAGGQAGYEGLVAYRKTLLALREAVAKADAQINALKAAIPAGAPEEVELADDLAEALLEYTGDVYAAVDKAMNQSENQATPVTKALADEINRFVRDLQANPLVKHVDANPFKVPVSVGGTLGAALDAVRKAMPAPR
jgi:hypothetical protein